MPEILILTYCNTFFINKIRIESLDKKNPTLDLDQLSQFQYC